MKTNWLKRILSCFLVVGLVMGTIVMPVAADDGKSVSDISDIAFETGLLKAVGIIPANSELSAELMESEISRAQFTVYAANLLNMSIRQSDVMYYRDVPLDYWAADEINFLASYGIFGADDEHKFYPEQAISYKEAFQILSALTGYDALFSVTNSEARYLAALKSTGLADNTSVGNLSDSVTVAEAFVMLYNALTVKLYETVQFGPDEQRVYKTSEQDTLLSAYFDIYYAEGTVTETPYTGLYDLSTINENEIKIDDTVYSYTMESEVPSDLIGKYVKVFSHLSKDESFGTVVYLYAGNDENEKIIIEAEDFVRFDGSSISYADEKGKMKTVHLSGNPVPVIKNGVAVLENITNAFSIDKGKITLLKSGNSQAYNIVLIDAYENFYVKAIDYSQNIVYNQYDNSANLYLGRDNIKHIEVRYADTGRVVSTEVIKPEDLLSVSASEDGSFISIYICNQLINGTVSLINGNGAETELTIDDKVYKTDASMLHYIPLRVGLSGQFILDVEGRVALYTSEVSDEETAAYVYAISKEGIFTPTIQLKLFIQSGEHIVLECADRVNVDGRPDSGEAVYSLLVNRITGKIKRQAIKYRLNADGEICYIDTAAVDSADKNTFRVLLDDSSVQVYFYESLLYPNTVMNDNTIVFLVPDEAEENPDEDDFAVVVAKDWFTANRKADIVAYKTNDDTPYADIVVERGANLTEISSLNNVLLVGEIIECINADGEPTKKLNCLSKNTNESVVLSPDIADTDIGSGDLIRVSQNSKGEVNNVIIEYDYSAFEGGKPDWAPMKNAYTDTFRLSFMYVIDKYTAPLNQNVVKNMLMLGKDEGSVIDESYALRNNTANVMIYDKNSRGAKAYMGNFDEIVTHTDDGGAPCSRIIIHAKYGQIMYFFIYK